MTSLVNMANPISTKNTKISQAWWCTPIVPAAWEAGITGTRHRMRPVFVFLVETGFHLVDQDGLDLLT